MTMTSEVKMLLRLQPHVLVEVRIQSTSSCDNFSLVGTSPIGLNFALWLPNCVGRTSMSALTFTSLFACNMQRGLQDVGDIPLCSRENARS